MAHQDWSCRVAWDRWGQRLPSTFSAIEGAAQHIHCFLQGYLALPALASEHLLLHFLGTLAIITYIRICMRVTEAQSNAFLIHSPFTLAFLGQRLG